MVSVEKGTIHPFLFYNDFYDIVLIDNRKVVRSLSPIDSLEMDYEKIPYGAYEMTEALFTENLRYGKAEFMRLNIRRIRLPDGKGNIVYLLSDTFEHSLDMIAKRVFVTPPTYRRFYYPWISFGNFMRRRYKMNLIKEKNDRLKKIKEITKLRPINTRYINKTNDNIFFSASDLYQNVQPIADRYALKKIYMEFWPEFCRLLREFTPDVMKENDSPEWNNRLIVIDADRFAFDQSAPAKENQTNPLFILYLAYLRTKDLRKLELDQDMMICSKDKFIKFNPSKMTQDKWMVFKRALFKIMGANLDDYTDNLPEEEKNDLEPPSSERMVRNIVRTTIDPHTQKVSSETKDVLQNALDQRMTNAIRTANAVEREIQKSQQTSLVQKKSSLSDKILSSPETKQIVPQPKNPIDRTTIRRKMLFRTMSQSYEPLEQDMDDDPKFDGDIRDVEDDIKNEIQDLMNTDDSIKEEVLDEVQNNVAPLKNDKTSPITSARDKKLREEQKKIVVRNETISEILERDSSNVPIQSEDKSKVLHTTNQNMKKITFNNFDKTYIDELYMKDLVACFDMLKDKEHPFYITGIDIKDTSTNMDLKETWSVHITDQNKKRSTIKVDIPKFYQNKFMLIGGNKYIILKQNFYNPLVKDTPDTVILTTNYNKVTIQRKATRSLSSVERIFSTIKKTGDDSVFKAGDSSKDNKKYISSLEYDELSRRLFRFKSKGCTIYFSRNYLQTNLADKIPKDIKGNEFYIGNEGDAPILINEDTGRDRLDRTIVDIIYEHLSDDYKAIFDSTDNGSGKQRLFAEGKMAGQFVPIIIILIMWIGLSKTMNHLGIDWEFHRDMKRVPKDSKRNYIKMKDGVLSYQKEIFAELIMNGLFKIKTAEFTFAQFDTEECYLEFIRALWGNYKGINEIRTFYEFLLDPITKDVCRDFMLPTEIEDLLIYAVKLLADNSCVSKASDKSYRVRSVEMIPAILYSCIAQQYKNYVKTGGREPMTLNQRVVITKLMGEKSVDEYSTLNPSIEIAKTSTISTKGFKGSNSEHSYDEEKRSYDPSSVGKIAISTSADANIGINRYLTIEPKIKNARGYRDETDLDELKDVNLFAPIEMITPGTIRVEDPIRSAIAAKQSQHLVPVADASPSLVSNGYDEVIQFHLSNDFVVNAEEDGEVIDVNEKVGFIVVKYKSGQTQAINIKPEIVKNSGGGFFISNELKPVYTKVGQKFKKDEVLAYHDKYFKYSKFNGLRHAIGPLTKVAFMSTYNTYEDAGICTQKMAEQMKSAIVYMQPAVFTRNANILKMAKIGDHVNIGDSLIKFASEFDDSEISKYLSKLSEENRALMEEETKNDVKADHAGKIVDVKVYSLLDPSQMSPTLGAVVQEFFDRGISKKKYLEKFDASEGILKAGYLLTDSTEPIQNRYGTIKGKYRGIDVLIEFYIEHDDIMGVGDKIALYSANKQIISEVIPEGYEPYSEFKPEESIDVMCTPGTASRRMVTAVWKISAAHKVLLGLKERIQDMIKYR